MATNVDDLIQRFVDESRPPVPMTEDEEAVERKRLREERDQAADFNQQVRRALLVTQRQISEFQSSAELGHKVNEQEARETMQRLKRLQEAQKLAEENEIAARLALSTFLRECDKRARLRSSEHSRQHHEAKQTKRQAAEEARLAALRNEVADSASNATRSRFRFPW